MLLTEENYHSQEANTEYISASQIKTACKCEAKWWAEITGKYKQKFKNAFLEGHYFETMLTGNDNDIALFQSQNPEMFSTRGISKGELKSNFLKVQCAIDAVKRQEMLIKIIANAKNQTIMTGEILGVKIKTMTDLNMPKSKSIYDLKAMRDFKNVYSEQDEEYQEWWKFWHYDIQLWLYREIAKQNGFYDENKSRYGLIGASKQEHSDVKPIVFSEETLDAAGQTALYELQRMKDIKAGLILPERCECCEYCKLTKIIKEFEVI